MNPKRVKSVAGSAPKRSVLVIEDDESLKTIFARVLESIDPSFRIDWATSGEVALEELKNPYDLVIADIFLAGKLTGLDVWQMQEMRNPRVPLVITSSLPLSRFLDSVSRDAICPPFLPKPFTVAECKSLLQGLLDYTVTV